jgi:hypothetical protein
LKNSATSFSRTHYLRIRIDRPPVVCSTLNIGKQTSTRTNSMRRHGRSFNLCLPLCLRVCERERRSNMIVENQKEKSFQRKKITRDKTWIEELHFKHRSLLQPTTANERFGKRKCCLECSPKHTLKHRVNIPSDIPSMFSQLPIGLIFPKLPP